MPTEPLQPFVPPTVLFDKLHIVGLPANGVLFEWALYLVFAFWAFYTLIAIYHWLKYSHGALVAFSAIGVHLFISFALMSYTLSGNAFIFTPYLP